MEGVKKGGRNHDVAVKKSQEKKLEGGSRRTGRMRRESITGSASSKEAKLRRIGCEVLDKQAGVKSELVCENRMHGVQLRQLMDWVINVEAPLDDWKP